MGETMPMGIGQLGFSNLIFKRKFRFTFELQDICGNKTVPQHFVRTAARPNLEVDETEINFLNAVAWLPGKARWQTMTVTYLDVATADMAPLYSWLASVYDFTDPVNLHMGSQRRDYTATAILKLWDGCGQLLEKWTMLDVWPKQINFGELDYSSSDLLEVELTMRYSQVKYEPICPEFKIEACCSPCRPGQSSSSASAPQTQGSGAAGGQFIIQ
jgi:hypothetical protein